MHSNFVSNGNYQNEDEEKAKIKKTPKPKWVPLEIDMKSRSNKRSEGSLKSNSK